MSAESRAIRRALGFLALSLGLLAAAVREPERTTPRADQRDEPRSVPALTLAEWIRAGRKGLHVIDLRDDSAYASYHVPSAERLASSRLVGTSRSAGETFVLYASDGTIDARTRALLRDVGRDQVYLLRGGASAWADEVMSPSVHGDSAEAVAALSRYFGGVPRLADDAIDRGSSRSTGRMISVTATSAIERARRRGC